MITGISGFGSFCPKMAVSWRKTVFQNMGCWNPYFYSVFWVRVFWPSCQKREILDTHQKRKNLTDNWFFWGGYFCVFSFCFSFVFLFFRFFLGFFFCFGGFKGQVGWPKGPPHLALNPPYLFVVLSSFFLSLLLNDKNPVFPLEKGILFISEYLPLFLLSFFWPPPFQFLFICLSLLLFFLFSFLSFFLLSFALFPFISSLLLFHEKSNIKIFNYKVFLHQYFLCFGFPVLFSLWNPFFLSLHFPHFRLCFLFNIIFWFQKTHVE